MCGGGGGEGANIDINGLVVMTDTAACIWKILPEVETEAEILKKILEEYEIDEETAQKDISDFLLLRKIFLHRITIPSFNSFPEIITSS